MEPPKKRWAWAKTNCCLPEPEPSPAKTRCRLRAYQKQLLETVPARLLQASTQSQALVDLPSPFHHLLPVCPFDFLSAHPPSLLPATLPSSLFCLPFQHPQVLLALALLYPPPQGYPQCQRDLVPLQRRQHHVPLPQLPAFVHCSDRSGLGLGWCSQSDTSSGVACSPSGGVGLPPRGSRYSPSASLRRPGEDYGSTPRPRTPSARSLARWVRLTGRCGVSPEILTSTSIRRLPLKLADPWFLRKAGYGGFR